MRLGSEENPRHILGVSGGKDSSALAIHMKQKYPEIFEKLELFFTDTGTELIEVYEYLDRLEKYLGKPILRIKNATMSEQGYKVADANDDSIPFNDVLNRWNGYLPSPIARWCTRELKIVPMERWIGQDHCFSYIGIRADEDTREGYSSRTKNRNITPVFPFRKDGLVLQDIYNILEQTVGLPEYYKWRTRSGCFFCFYQRRVEWAIMYLLYPHLFLKSKEYETEHEDGRTFTWIKDRPLDYIEGNPKEIIIRYVKKQYKKSMNKEQFTYNIDEMVNLIQQDNIKELIDSWDIKKLHDVDGENKEGCNVCAT